MIAGFVDVARESDTLVDLVYEGLLESDPWSSFLHAFRLSLHSSSTMLMFGRPSGKSLERDIDDSEWQVKTLQKLYYSRFQKNNPIRYQEMDFGRVYSMDEFISFYEMEKSEYYNEFMKNSNLYYALICRVGDVNETPSWLNVARAKAQGPYTLAEHQMMAQLVPHINRALRLDAAMVHVESQKIAYGRALDPLRLAIVLLDRTGAILSMNSKAEDILSHHPAFRNVGKRLRMAHTAEQRQFDALLARVLGHNGGRDGNEADNGVMPIGERADAPLNLLLRRFAREEVGRASESLISAVLYIKDPAEILHASTDAIGVLYGLRPTEARLAAALAGGASIREASVHLGMSEQTVRTYVKRILQKTGTHRQVDLVQLINSSLAIMT